MSSKFIIIVLGEPYSVFSELLGKFFSLNRKFKKKIIIVGNKELLNGQLKKLGYSIKMNDMNNIKLSKLKKINILNIKFKYKKLFSNITKLSNDYLKESFYEALKITKINPKNFIFLNGPVSKKTFFNKKYLGVTEYLSKKTDSKNEVMLIYNEKLSVSPITTHIPLKNVAKKINKQKIINNVLKLNSFYKNIIKKKPKFAILGLNPHCETVDIVSEEEKIIIPSIKNLKKKKVDISGPFSADTFFLKKNIDKYDVVVGMYHDQVLTPIKTLFNFNAINITVGLPFIRISPDHGPNSKMLGKNKSDPSSLKYALKFADKY